MHGQANEIIEDLLWSIMIDEFDEFGIFSSNQDL